MRLQYVITVNIYTVSLRPPPPGRPKPSAKRKAVLEQKEEEMAKRKRSFDDFFNFCNFVLAYEEKLAAAEHQPTANHTDTNSVGESSPSSSGNSSTSSEDSGNESGGSGQEEGASTPLTPSSPNSSSTADVNNDKLEYTSDDESWNLVTCFCRRPFAGRPMIECHRCQTWVHLFCAKIKKDSVPDIYVCPKCRVPHRKGAISRQREEKRSDHHQTS